MSRKNIERAQALYGDDYGKTRERAPAVERSLSAPTGDEAEKVGKVMGLKDKQGRDSYDRAAHSNRQPGRRRIGSVVQLHDMAMVVPLTKRQKALAEELGLREPSRPTLRRGAHLQVDAIHGSVERFVEQANPASPQELVGQIASAAGYADGGAVSKAGRRVARFMAKFQEGGRMPRHIRDKAITLSAMAQGVKIAFPAAYAAGAGLAEA